MIAALARLHTTKQTGTMHANGTNVTYHHEPHHGDVNRNGKQNEMSKNSDAAE